MTVPQLYDAIGSMVDEHGVTTILLALTHKCHQKAQEQSKISVPMLDRKIAQAWEHIAERLQETSLNIALRN